MKKTGIINSEVSAVVANMGHMDWLSIGDAGMPVPFGTKKIDLAVAVSFKVKTVLNCVIKISLRLAAAPHNGKIKHKITNWNIGVRLK